MERKRIDYFDVLRVLSMFGVIFMHVAAAPLRSGMGRSWLFFHIPTSFFFTAVPIFFMISGALLLSDPRTRDASGFYRRHLPKLLVPLAVWSALTILTRFATQPGYTFSQFCKALLEIPEKPAITPLWFPYTLLPIYILAPFLKTMLDGLDLSGRRRLAVLIAAVSVYETLYTLLPEHLRASVGIDALHKLFLLEGYLGYFLLGYLLHTTAVRFSNRALVLVGGADFALIVLDTWRLSVRAGKYTQRLQGQNMACMVLLAVCLFLLLKQICRFGPERRWWKSLLRWLSPLSFAVYLMHGAALQLLPLLGVQIRYWRGALLGLVLVTVSCVAGAFLLSSARPLCFPFTGLSYRSACASCNLRFLLEKRAGNRSEK